MKEKNGLMGSKLINLLIVFLIGAFVVMKGVGMWSYKEEDDGYTKHMTFGKEYMEQGYYVDAGKEFERADELRPSENTKLYRAECYLLLGDMNMFRQLAEEVQNTYGSSERLYMDFIYYYEALNDRTSEINMLITAVNEYPDSEYLRNWYDAIKGEYRTVGEAYEDIRAIPNDYEITRNEGLYSVVQANERSCFGDSFDEIYDVYDGDELMIAALKDGCIKYYDSNGYMRVTPEGQYSYLGLFRDGYALAKCDTGWVYIDKETTEISVSYDEATAFKENIAAIKKDGKWQLVNNEFEAITASEYDDIVCNEFKECVFEGRIFVEENGLYSMLDTNGKEIASGYDAVKPFAEENGYAAVHDGDGWKIIDADGNVVECVECDELEASGNKMAAYRIGDKWGYIGIGDGVYVEPSFDSALRVNSKGYAAVKIGEEYRYIQFLRFENNTF